MSVTELACQRAREIRLMAFDIDGVMTDGTLYYHADGSESKAFNVLDGHGLKMLRQGGVNVAIISGRACPALAARAANLGLTEMLRMGVADKRAELVALAEACQQPLSACGYMGDDVVDLPILRAAGFSAAPANAHAFVKEHVLWVSRARGGAGAVREVCEFLLEAQGKLGAMLQEYLQ